jgi:ABC-type dipeptide/oligopeptide/nickel transport system permease subunit
MISRIIVALYFLIGIVVAVNQGYLDGGIDFTADGLWRLANFVLAAGFWPLIVLTPYNFRLPDALLQRA